MRALDVFIDRRRVGALHEAEDLWRFEYDAEWAQSPDAFDLAPALSRAQLVHVDGGTTRPVQWYFDNLLPEELLRESIAREAGLAGDDAFALLEYLGAESAGSLTLLPSGATFPETAGLRVLSDQQLHERIAALPFRTLASDAPKRMSLAGAQHKLLVVYHEGRLFEPVGTAPSTHILKPQHPDTAHYPASVINEYVAMQLAAAAGLDVPEVYLHRVPEPVYVVRRFDRDVREGPEAPPDALPNLDVRRRHIIDACQLLGRSRLFKHVGATLASLRAIVERTTNRLHTRLGLFRWLVFNVAIANDDCHLKNLSFQIAAGGIRLAPHYDLLSTGAYSTRAFADDRAEWPDRSMAVPLPGAGTFGEVRRDALLAAAGELGVPSRTAERILGEVTRRLPDALSREIAELEKAHAGLAPEARVHAAAEMRLVRVIERIVLPEMLGRMS